MRAYTFQNYYCPTHISTEIKLIIIMKYEADTEKNSMGEGVRTKMVPPPPLPVEGQQTLTQHELSFLLKMFTPPPIKEIKKKGGGGV